MPGHAFCIGGATELLLEGVHLDIVATQGHWKSRAFQDYWHQIKSVLPLFISAAATTPIALTHVQSVMRDFQRRCTLPSWHHLPSLISLQHLQLHFLPLVSSCTFICSYSSITSRVVLGSSASKRLSTHIQDTSSLFFWSGLVFLFFSAVPFIPHPETWSQHAQRVCPPHV